MTALAELLDDTQLSKLAALRLELGEHGTVAGKRKAVRAGSAIPAVAVPVPGEPR
jgi:hypothetical protein